VAANIAEAEGRYFKKDKIRFLYQARGSLTETIHWINMAKDRKLLTHVEARTVDNLVGQLPFELNSLISSISKNLKR